MKNEPTKLRIANGFADALTQIATISKKIFDEHEASKKVLNYEVTPTTEAAYIFGVCSAVTQLAVALMHATEDDNKDVYALPFKIDIENAIEKYKEALLFEKELDKTLEDKEEEYEQITIDDLLEMLNKKLRNKKPKKGE